MRRWLACAVLVAACSDEDSIFQLRHGTPCPQVVMREVNDVYIVTHPVQFGADADTAVYFIGDLAAGIALGEPRYIAFARLWSEINDYDLNGQNKYYGNGDIPTGNPEYQAAGQVFLSFYARDRDPIQSASIARSIDNIVRNRPRDNWGFAEAQFFASPAYAQLGVLSGQQRYFDTMFQLFLFARDIWNLFDRDVGLWFRDYHFHFPQRQEDGKPIFWSRANGYVLGSIARTLPLLPADSPFRPTYVDVFRRMSATLAIAQRPDGLWNVNLLDPEDHPGVEESGSALITFGLAWGINNGIIDRATFLPIVDRAWRGIVANTVRQDLQIGFVQGFARRPEDAQPVTIEDTGRVGVGAFLLAGSEVLKLGLDLDCPAGTGPL